MSSICPNLNMNKKEHIFNMSKKIKFSDISKEIKLMYFQFIFIFLRENLYKYLKTNDFLNIKLQLKSINKNNKNIKLYFILKWYIKNIKE